jgi:hypothetical protein
MVLEKMNPSMTAGWAKPLRLTRAGKPGGEGYLNAG